MESKLFFLAQVNYSEETGNVVCARVMVSNMFRLTFTPKFLWVFPLDEYVSEEMVENTT